LKAPPGKCETDEMKDDSARDKAFDRMMAHKLDARLQDEGRDCPDAEILAAYVERTLSPAERQTWETHLVACRFCQEQVAQLVRLSESDEIEEAAKRAPAKPRVAWFRWALAAPALVALVVAGLWYTGEFRPLLWQEEPTATKAPQSPTPTLATQPRGKGAAAKSPTAEELSKKTGPNRETAERAAALKPPPRISVYGSPGSSVEVKPSEGGAAASGVGRASNAGASVTSAERQAVVAQAGAPAPAAKEFDRMASRRVRASAEEMPSAPGAPTAEPGQEAASNLAVGGKGLSGGLVRAGTAAKQSAAPLQAETEAATRPEARRDSGVEFHGFIQERRTWRVGPGGLIQKAAADGSWETRPSGVKADLFGISFANSEVGWAVGQGGTVLRTTDGGATWTRMPNPTSEDLVRVGAISPTKVNVITRSGQTLQSTDGGQTWKPLG
jgi:hypothetical protein